MALLSNQREPETVSVFARAPASSPESPAQRRLRFLREYGAWRRATRELWRFKWREHRAASVVGAYHTRGSRIPYFVRHGTRDVGIFSEIFIAGEYEPPPPVAQRLSELGRPPRVLDLGGNVGLFAAFCRDRWPGCTVVSVEPDPENLEILRRTARAGASIEVIEACAGTRDGLVRFVTGQFAESHVADADAGEESIEVGCIDVFGLASSMDLVKIDIEGTEWEILADDRLTSLPSPAVVMEWHDKQCPHRDPSAEARAALRSAGYTILSEHRPVPNNGTLWALRPH